MVVVPLCDHIAHIPDFIRHVGHAHAHSRLFDHGDCLIFSRTDVIRSGQIGAFSLNGAYYCKKYCKDVQDRHWLISENRDYAPSLIHPEDEFRVLVLYKLRITKSGQ